MVKSKDALVAMCVIVACIAAFYAFKVLVVLLVGYAIYLSLPVLRKLHKWFR